MKDVNVEFEYKGKTYKLVFNLNVMEQIQDEYGSIDKWATLTEGENGEPNVKAVKFGFTAMINEAIEIDNEENGTDTKPVTKNFVGRMLTDVGINAMASKMQETVIESTKTTEKKRVIPDEEDTEYIMDFTWYYFIGRNKLGFTFKEVGRLTLTTFNKYYKHYKDTFDYEMRLTKANITYGEAYEKITKKVKNGYKWKTWNI